MMVGMRGSERIAGALLAAVAGFGSCQSVPEDHYLPRSLGQSLGRLGKRLDPWPLIQRSGRRVVDLTSTARELLPWENGELQRFAAIPQRIVDDEGGRLVDGPGAMVATTGRIVDLEIDGALRLAAEDSTLREVASPTRALDRLDRAITRSPRALGLDRRILPSPTDPERQTELVIETRRESFFERLLRRIRW